MAIAWATNGMPAIVEREIAASGAGMGGCSAVHIGIFGFEPIIHTAELLDAVRGDWRQVTPLLDWVGRHG